MKKVNKKAIKKAQAKIVKNWNPDKEHITIELHNMFNAEELLLQKDINHAMALIASCGSLVEKFNHYNERYEVEKCLALEIEIDVQLEIINDFFRFARKFKNTEAA